MSKVKAADLVLDYTLYPRHNISAQHVADIRQAIRAGNEMPPVIAEEKTHRVVDGFHRVTAALGLDKASAVAVEWRAYKTEQEFFLDAIALNAAHGEKLTPYDRARCLTRGDELKIQPERIAEAMHITMMSLEKLRITKVAISGGKPIPIKRTLDLFAGQNLTARQVEGNRRAGGSRPLFFVNQVINLIESRLVKPDDLNTIKALERLAHLLREFLRKKAA